MRIARTVTALTVLTVSTLGVAGVAHATTGDAYEPTLPQSEITKYRKYCTDLGYPNVEIVFDDVTLEVESVTCFKADGTWRKPQLPVVP